MPEKNSNKTSLIVALVAVFLIVGGIYILNQSISQPRNEEVAVVEEEVEVETEPEEEFQSIDDMGGEYDDFEEEGSALSELEQGETIEEDPVIEEEPEEVIEEEEEEEETNSNLTESQILVTYTGKSDEGYEKFKIVECGNKDLSSCRPGLNIMLSTKTSGIAEDENYIINGTISDGDGGLSISGATVTKA